MRRTWPARGRSCNRDFAMTVEVTLIVADSPRRTLFVSLSAATTVPLALYLARVRGVDMPEHGFSILTLVLPPYLCAAIAVVPARLIQQLGKAVASGRIKYRETVAQGLENAPRAFIGMLKGENLGKQLVKVA